MRAVLYTVLAAWLAVLPGLGAAAQPAASIQVARSARVLTLETGAGRVLTLPVAAANIFVADPKVAEVRPGSATSLFLFGVGAGRTTVAAMDNAGKVIAQYDVAVRPSAFAADSAQATMSRLIREGRVSVTPEAKGLLLTGSVPSPADAERAVAIARGYLADGQSIDNQISVRSAVQVNLRVRIVEMNRSVSRSLGVNWTAMGTLGAFATNYALPASGVGASTALAKYGSKDVNVLIDALAQDNLARVLAEPNLTVISGEAGSFLVGGEFPVPVAQQNNTTTIDFKNFGVALRFVPTVLSDGRINLHVSPEVSQLSTQGAVTLSASNSNISVPALTVRRAETTVELGSGQTFALAGLLQDSVTTGNTGVPFLGDLPVIGALFRSNAFQRQETELVILVTPYVVHPVNDPSALHTPGEHYTAPNDFERILMGRQQGAATARTAVHIPGDAGFIVQ